MRGKGVRKSSRASNSPYAGRPGERTRAWRGSTSASTAQAIGAAPAVMDPENQRINGDPLSPQQLEEVVEQVSARVAQQLIEAVQQAIEPRISVQPDPEGINTNTSLCNINEMSIDPGHHQVTSVNDSLGRNVSSTIRQKIHNNEFIDLGQLLVKPTPVDDDKHFTLVNGELVVKGKTRITKIVDIDMWTDAFTVFISIYTSVHSADIAGLLKYMHTVRLGAKRTGGLAWRNYDEQFRLKKAQNQVMPWGQIDQELWLLYMSSQVNPSTNKVGNRSNSVFRKKNLISTMVPAVGVLVFINMFA